MKINGSHCHAWDDWPNNIPVSVPESYGVYSCVGRKAPGAATLVIRRLIARER